MSDEVRARLHVAAKKLFREIDAELVAFEPRALATAEGFVDLLIDKSQLREKKPGGCCGRCEACGSAGVTESGHSVCIECVMTLRPRRPCCAACGAPLKGSTK